MMDSRVLHLLVREAANNNIGTPETRYQANVVVQKFIYLLQQALDEQFFEFLWYWAGPYSSELTAQLQEDVYPQWISGRKVEGQLNGDVKAAIADIKALISKVQELEPSLAEYEAYKLAASIWYLKKSRQTVDEIEIELKLNLPYFERVGNMKQLIRLVVKAVPTLGRKNRGKQAAGV